MSMLNGHPFNFPLFELYCAPIYAPIAHHFFMNVRKHLSSFKWLQAQKMMYSFIFNDLCQTAKNSVRCVTNHNAQFHICSQLLCCLAWHAIPFKNLTRLLIITHPSPFLKARLDFRCDFCLNFLWMPVLPYSAASRIVSVILHWIGTFWIRSLSFLIFSSIWFNLHVSFCRSPFKGNTCLCFRTSQAALGKAS